jgi:BirA family transcriptional regulator, biotin operon repressor / biotin---[acetyl-CoA-carboxylase] ligase
VLNYSIHQYPTINSTNDEAKVLLRQGANEGTVVLADRQTAGRGRWGRSWISGPGNLYCSIILKPQCTLLQAGQLSFVMAVSVGEAILPYLKSIHKLTYKWPNDLLINQQKVCGILIETESESGGLVDACIVGIGINLSSVPDNPTYPVTALNLHTEAQLALDDLFAALLEKINKKYQQWRQYGFEELREKWLERADSLGEMITVTIENKKKTGKFLGLNMSGGLLFLNENGNIDELMSVEVS